MDIDRKREARPRDLVLPFSALGRESLRVAGGKAMNLGELTRAAFEVPPGFCVTTAAYALAARGSDIGPMLEPLAGASPGDRGRLTELAAQAREAIQRAPVPEAVARAVRQAYRALGEAVPVAVRSSATAEDLPGASFAGQQDTFLNVIGEDAVIDAVRRCWASLWTDRAVAYRAQQGIDPRDVELAVAVQRMVRARVAGVLFTANPLTGRRGQALIDASSGLGEAVVSGAVNPDHFEVDTATGSIAERRLGDKKVVIEAAPGGGTRHVEREDASGEACVSDEEVRALARLGARVEAYYGAPQDIEWAIDEERRIWLLQARPITTLFPLPAGAESGGYLRVYLSINVAQGVFRPFTPMGAQCMRMFVGGMVSGVGFPPKEPEEGPSFVVEAAHRLFVDVTGVLKSPIGRRVAGFGLARMEARSAAIVRRLEEDPRLPQDRGGTLRTALHILGALARTGVPLTMARALLAPEEARVRNEDKAAEAMAFGEVRADAPPEAKLEAAERLLYRGFFVCLSALLPTALAGMLCSITARGLLNGLSTDREREAVMRALPHNPTTEMDLELWALAERLRANEETRALLLGTPPVELAARYQQGELPADLLSELRRFFERYGHRGVAEIDAGVARWSEEPTHILGSIANFFALEDAASGPGVQFRRAEAEAEVMVAELTRRARAAGWLRGAIVGFALSRTRALAGTRELPKFHMVRALARVRNLLLDIAAGLVKQGRLNAAEDIFMLRLAEVRSALGGSDMRETARARRASYRSELLRRRIPRVLLSDGTEPEEEILGASVDPASTLTGTPASAGRVAARARVVLDPVGAKLEPGEILVAPSTDPGWTPLFMTAAGLVMEMGGAMSHGAVVARECGIPAVVGVAHATSRITTGQLLIMDGAKGTVELAEEERSGVSEPLAAQPEPRTAAL